MDPRHSAGRLDQHAQSVLGEELRAYYAHISQSIPAPLVELLQRLRDTTGATSRHLAPSPPPAADHFFDKAFFDPAILQALHAAFEEAWSMLGELGIDSVTREEVAQRLISLASEGERDASRLCAKALVALIAHGRAGTQR